MVRVSVVCCAKCRGPVQRVHRRRFLRGNRHCIIPRFGWAGIGGSGAEDEGGKAVLVEAPAFMRGKERFSAPGRVRPRSRALALAIEKPRAKAHFKSRSFSAGLKSSSPLLKQGASTKSLPRSLSAVREDTIPVHFSQGTITGIFVVRSTTFCDKLLPAQSARA